jgi:hypothetical protein
MAAERSRSTSFPTESHQKEREQRVALAAVYRSVGSFSDGMISSSGIG